MTVDPRSLVYSYLDDTLSPEEHAILQTWLKESPVNAQRFADDVLLHDRLRGEHLALDALANADTPVNHQSAPLQVRRTVGRRPITAIAVGLLVATAASVLIWISLAGASVSAATELKRIIVASMRGPDRTYRITVEELPLLDRGDSQNATTDDRPPKPPIDNATLHVRSGNQFVLIRQTPEGRPFVTGSNGKTSWAVKPDGSVRVSSDLNRFNRDLPGHEHAMPLINLADGLDRLRQAYDIEILPVEPADDDAAGSGEQSRLMVAVKKRGFRGPRRVEITYFVASGLIRQMRFVEMPYGPERLTLRLTLIEERPLGESFFDHTSHHDAQRTIEVEE
jgi:hypothetical protein